MKHEIVQNQGASVVIFKGEIDLESSPEARELLLGSVAGGKSLLVWKTESPVREQRGNWLWSGHLAQRSVGVEQGPLLKTSGCRGNYLKSLGSGIGPSTGEPSCA